jgi:hypothetical protein
MIKAEIVAHSLSPQGEELISVLATFPRIILAEVNTHRMLSKNTSSSRAIPFLKMVETIENNPFIPIAWQKEHKGMQGTEYLTEERDTSMAIQKWLRTRDLVVQEAKFLNDSVKVTKQLTNRLLEPFMWTTMLITGSKSGWDNFFKLRCPQYLHEASGTIYNSRKDFITRDFEDYLMPFDGGNSTNLDWLKINKGQAEIHIMDLAEKIWDAKNESTPIQLEAGQWHIPFWDKINLNFGDFFNITGKGTTNFQHIEELKVKMSVAMGARTSYTIVGEEKEINPETLIGLHDKLLTWDPPHSSPFEHCARAMSTFEYASYYRGKLHNPEFQDGTDEIIDYLVGMEESSMGWCYNLKGFIPYRYLVDNSLTL